MVKYGTKRMCEHLQMLDIMLLKRKMMMPSPIKIIHSLARKISQRLFSPLFQTIDSPGRIVKGACTYDVRFEGRGRLARF